MVGCIVDYGVIEYDYHSNAGISVKDGVMIEIYEKLEVGKLNWDTSRN